MREFSVQPLTANGGRPTACGERRSVRSARVRRRGVVRTLPGSILDSGHVRRNRGCRPVRPRQRVNQRRAGHSTTSFSPPRRCERPTPQARDAPEGECCVESNRRPHQNADESHTRASVCENRDSGAVIQHHRRDQPAAGAVRSVIARQPAGAAQRDQRSAGDAAHYQRGRRIKGYAEQQPGDKRR